MSPQPVLQGWCSEGDGDLLHSAPVLLPVPNLGLYPGNGTRVDFSMHRTSKLKQYRSAFAIPLGVECRTHYGTRPSEPLFHLASTSVHRTYAEWQPRHGLPAAAKAGFHSAAPAEANSACASSGSDTDKARIQ
jgi:hypothetical protein